MPLLRLHRGFRNRTRDRWILRHVPITIVEYPLESVLGAWGFIAGSQVVFGISTPSIAMLPWPLPVAWSILMMSAGVYVIYGLRRRAYGSLVASGISMFGWVLAAYGVAILMLSDDIKKSLTVVLLLFAFSLISFMRAWFLRARDDMLIAGFNLGSSNGVNRPTKKDNEEPHSS